MIMIAATCTRLVLRPVRIDITVYRAASSLRVARCSLWSAWTTYNDLPPVVQPCTGRRWFGASTSTENDPNDISSMSSKTIKEELQSYGINTDRLLEKQDYVEALQEARAQGFLPLIKATVAMKQELSSYGIETDKVFDRNLLESLFLKASTAIRFIFEEIAIKETINKGSTMESEQSNDITDSNKSKGAIADNTKEREEGANEKLENCDQSHDSTSSSKSDEALAADKKQPEKLTHEEIENGEANRASPIENEQSSVNTDCNRTDSALTDGIKVREKQFYDEIANCEVKMIPELQTELENTWGVSPVQIVVQALAVARTDGIVNNVRVFPSILWKSMRMQDLILDSFVDPLYRDNAVFIRSDYMSNNSSTDPNILARDDQIKNEAKNCHILSLRKIFNELEYTWGISPRCLYVCAVAVLRVYGLEIDGYRDNPVTQSVVDEAMSNTKLDGVLLNALSNAKLRAKIQEYIRNPMAYKKYMHDPEFKKILENPVWLAQFQKYAPYTFDE
jgi:hypothetical protein